MDAAGVQTGQMVWPNGHGRILKALREHGNVLRACRDTSVSHTRVYAWIDEDPDYRAAFEEARAIGRRGFRDACVDHLYRAITDGGATTADTLRTAIRVLAQYEPQVWAERSRTEVSGPDGGPIPLGRVVLEVVHAERPADG